MKVKIVSASGLLPKYQTAGAAGMDIAAYLNENIVIESGQTVSIPTGLRMEIPIGYELQLRSRSGLSFKGICVANSPGTIDSDFRGEIKILLHNASKEPFIVENGMRIAQGVFAAYERVVFEQVETSELSETERGEKGFGSTGVKSEKIHDAFGTFQDVNNNDMKNVVTEMAKKYNESVKISNCKELKVGTTLMAKNDSLNYGLFLDKEYVVLEVHEGSANIIEPYTCIARYFSTDVNHPYYFGNFFEIV